MINSWVDRGTFWRYLQLLSSYAMNREMAYSFGAMLPRHVYQTAHPRQQGKHLKRPAHSAPNGTQQWCKISPKSCSPNRFVIKSWMYVGVVVLEQAV